MVLPIHSSRYDNKWTEVYGSAVDLCITPNSELTLTIRFIYSTTCSARCVTIPLVCVCVWVCVSVCVWLRVLLLVA